MTGPREATDPVRLTGAAADAVLAEQAAPAADTPERRATFARVDALAEKLAAQPRAQGAVNEEGEWPAGYDPSSLYEGWDEVAGMDAPAAAVAADVEAFTEAVYHLFGCARVQGEVYATKGLTESDCHGTSDAIHDLITRYTALTARAEAAERERDAALVVRDAAERAGLLSVGEKLIRLTAERDAAWRVIADVQDMVADYRSEANASNIPGAYVDDIGDMVDGVRTPPALPAPAPTMAGEP